MTERKPGGPAERRSWPIERLLAHYSARADTGCLLWTRPVTRAGYGKIQRGDREQYAHRLAWSAANGRAVPDGMQVCHRCDVRHCIEPSHLFLGTSADNMADMVAKGRQAFGERSGFAKLTTQQVTEIRAAEGSFADIASRFQITKHYVGEIRRGRRRRLG